MTRIKCYTRSMDAFLWYQSQALLTLPYPRVRVTDSDALGYLLTAIADEDADYVVNIDEDAFVFDNDALQELLNHVIDYGYVNCGMPDGGVHPTRQHNPLVTNPFFTIMHTARLREAVREGAYIGTPITDVLPDWYPAYLLTHDYAPGSFEPYDALYTWIANTYPVLYLDADTHADGISTVLKNHQGTPFLTHTWYARAYHDYPIQRRRIDAAIAEAVNHAR